MVNLILLGLFVLLVGLGMLGGLIKGLAKARIRGICVIGCAIAAVILTLTLRKVLITQKVLDSILAELGNAQVFKDLMAASPSLCKIMLNCVSSLASPLLCLAIYIVLAFVTWIIYLIVTLILHGALRRYNKRCKLGKLRAVIWGGVKGLVVFVMLMIPVSAYLEIGTPVLESVLEANVLDADESAKLQDVHDTYLKPANNGVVKVYRNLGGKLVVDSLTDFKLGKEKVDFSKEIGSMATLGCNVMQLTKSDFKDYGDEEAATFNAIADSLGSSTMLSSVTGDLVYGATDSWLRGEKYFGVSKPSTGELSDIVDPFMQTLLEILNTDAHDHTALKADIHTVADMVNVFSTHGVFSSFSDEKNMMTALGSDGLVTEMVTTLGSNNSMKRLIPEITNMGVRAIGSVLGLSDDVPEVYDSLLQDIAKSVNHAKTNLPEEERAAYLTEKLGVAFDEAGVPIADEILVCYSASMIQDFVNNGDRSTIKSRDVQAFFEIYANNTVSGELSADSTETLSKSEALATDPYAGTVYAGKTEEELKQTGAAVLANVYTSIADISASGSDDLNRQASEMVLNAYKDMLGEESSAFKNLESFAINEYPTDADYKAAFGLSDSAKMPTTKVLLKDLLLDTKNAAALLDAAALASESEVISAIFEAADSLKNQIDSPEEIEVGQIATLVGRILDALRQSACYGNDKTADLFTAIMQSKTLRDLAGIDLKTATSMAEKGTAGDVDYGKTMSVISSTVNVMNSFNSTDEVPSEEALLELVQNITPQSAGMIKEFDTASKMKEYNVPEDYADLSSSILNKTLENMANSDLSEEEYAKEAAALNQVVNLAMSAKDSSTATCLFAKDGEKSVLPGTAKETVETLMASNAICGALRESVLDDEEVGSDPLGINGRLTGDAAVEEREECQNAMVEYYNENPTEDNKESLTAIAILLGVSTDGSFLG